MPKYLKKALAAFALLVLAAPALGAESDENDKMARLLESGMFIEACARKNIDLANNHALEASLDSLGQEMANLFAKLSAAVGDSARDLIFEGMKARLEKLERAPDSLSPKICREILTSSQEFLRQEGINVAPLEEAIKAMPED